MANLDQAQNAYDAAPPPGSLPGRPLTGRMVLVWIVSFFAVVGTVNAIMVAAALTTFGGLETQNAYKAGLAFNTELRAAHQQEARNWQVSGHAGRTSAGLADVTVNVAAAQALPGDLVAQVRLSHPTDARFDRPVPTVASAPGVFRGAVEAPAGQWDLTIDLVSAGERVFRSRNRIRLP